MVVSEPGSLKKVFVSLEEMPKFRPKRSSNEHKFAIRHATELRLYLGDGIFGNVPTQRAESSSKLPLG